MGAELAVSEIEHQLSSLHEELEGLEETRTNVLDVLGIESRERRLTRFLRWLLTPNASHGGGDVFLREFLDLAGLGSIELVRTQQFFTVNRGPGEDNAEIDIVLIGQDTCVGIEIKTTHQEKRAKLDREYRALENSFSSAENHELIYLTFAPNDSSVPEVPYVTVFWADLMDRFDGQLTELPGEYEQRLITDFIDTIRTHVMTDFNQLSDRTELYLKYADAVDQARSSYEEDRDTILDALATEFYARTDGGEWERTNTYSGKYIKLYKPAWHSLENSVNMEVEPHVDLRAGSAPDSPGNSSIKVRFDVEGRDAQTVRTGIRDRLGEEGVAELESQGFSLFTKDESTYKFIGKSVPLSDGSEDYDPIAAAVTEIQNLLDIVEEHADAVAAEY